MSEEIVTSSHSFDAPEGVRELRLRDLLTIAGRSLGADAAAPWQVAAMVKTTVDAMARPTGARRAALAEAAAVAVKAPAPLVARALLSLMSTTTTFRICELVAEVERMAAPEGVAASQNGYSPDDQGLQPDAQ